MAAQDPVRKKKNRFAFAPTGDPRMDTIKAEIEETEARIAGTLEALKEKLSFDNLKNRAEEKIREVTARSVKAMVSHVESRTREVRQSMLETIRENPIPLVVVGMGLSWFLMGGTKKASRMIQEGQRYLPQSMREERYWLEPENLPDDLEEAGIEYDFAPAYREGRQYGEPRSRMRGVMEAARSGLSEAQRRAQEVAGQVRREQRPYGAEVRGRMYQGMGAGQERYGETQERTREMADRLRHRGEQYGREAYHRAQEAKSGLLETLQEHPVAVGAAAIAIGAIIGLYMPETRRERHWAGERGEGFVQRAREAVGEVKERVEHVAREAGQGAQEEARRRRHTEESMTEKAGRVAGEATQRAKEESKREGLTP